MRKQEYLVQGTPEWLQFRLAHNGASEAGAMLGLSKLSNRNELLKIKSTGISKEFSDFVQRFVLDKGHEVEALARPIVESIIDDQLYPVTFSMGRLSASCDGLTGMGDIAFEHKQWNQAYAEMVRKGELPEEHWPQCQQVLLLTAAEKLIFVISDGTQENMAWMWVYPDKTLQDAIVAGWSQFDKDLAEYVPAAIPEKPIAEPTESLPSVSIRVDGGLSVISNLDLFGSKLREFVGNLTKDPQDDQDFANLEQAVKDLKKAEDALSAAEDMALAQISDVNDMRRTVADLKEIARSHRLTSEKLVKSQKEVIKLKILSDIKDKFNAHIAGLQSEIKGVRLDISMPDFAGSMKNKRTIASLHEAVDTLLANSKIEADRVAKDLREKLTWLKKEAVSFGFLLSDLQSIITSNSLEAFQAIVNKRIDDHKKAEAERLAAEREKMRLEEEAKAAAKVKAEQEQAEAEKLAERERLERENQEMIEQASTKKDDDINKVEVLPEKHAEAEHVVEQLIGMAKTYIQEKPIKGGNTSIEMVMIPKAEYEKLLKRDEWLDCLEQAGVDNWSGIDYAHELMTVSA